MPAQLSHRETKALFIDSPAEAVSRSDRLANKSYLVVLGGRG